jgi:hypothetical protein
VGYERQCGENAERLASAISGLRALVDQADHKAFWVEVRRVNALFQTLKPLSRDDRQSLRSLLNDLCEQKKRAQSEERERLQRQSRGKRAIIEGKITEAVRWVDNASDESHTAKARALLDECNELMRSGWQTENTLTQIALAAAGDLGRLTREDREACRQRLSDAWTSLRFRGQAIRDANYRRIEEHTADAWRELEYGRPHEAIQLVKATQREMRDCDLTRTQRTVLRDKLQSVFGRACSRLDALRAERERRHEEWATKQEAFIARLQEAIDRQEDTHGRLESQIADCEARLAAARTPEFEARVRGWIDEKRAIQANIADSIRDMRRKIDDARARSNR